MGHAAREFSSLPPAWLLFLFCCINMINYLDRGMIASNGVNGSAGCEPQPATPTLDCDPSGIQGDFKLTNFADGLLPTAFLVGLLVASPLFAHASKTHSPALLMAVGLLVWCAAVVGCGFSWNFFTLLVCRMFVGVGEASFVSLAAPCISDCAPPAKVSLWLAYFYLCIPAGFALGFIYGGLVASAAGWRAAFLLEALLMGPFVPYLLYRWWASRQAQQEELLRLQAPLVNAAEDPHGTNGPLRAPSGTLVAASNSEVRPEFEDLVEEGRGVEGASGAASMAASAAAPVDPSGTDAGTGLWEDLGQLLGNAVYVRNLLGYSAYTFVLGAFAFWGPKAMKVLYERDDADTLFGAVTVITGVGGTLGGGLALDSLGSSLPTAFKLMGVSTLIGGVFCTLAFLTRSLVTFLVLIIIGELFLFVNQSPANLVAMQSVPPVLRALAIAAATIAVHVLGDVPSPPLLGALQDACRDFRLSMGVFSAVLFPAGIIWYSGSWLCAGMQHANKPAGRGPP